MNEPGPVIVLKGLVIMVPQIRVDSIAQIDAVSGSAIVAIAIRRGPGSPSPWMVSRSIEA